MSEGSNPGGHLPPPATPDPAGFGPPARPPLPDELPVERRGVLSDHEEPVSPRDPEEEIRRAEVAVGDPEVLRRDQRQDLVQQRSLLGMTVFTQHHVGGQHPSGVEDDQRMAGQGSGADRPQLLEPVFGPGEMVAVEEANAITVDFPTVGERGVNGYPARSYSTGDL